MVLIGAEDVTEVAVTYDSWERHAPGAKADCNGLQQAWPMALDRFRQDVPTARGDPVTDPGGNMSAAEIDDYLARLDEPQRSTLEALRQSILAVIPDAEQGLSYGVPAFRIDGKPVAGFSAAQKHLSYLPHSGDVLATFSRADLEGFSASKGALRMPIDSPPGADLVRKLIAARRAEADV